MYPWPDLRCRLDLVTFPNGYAESWGNRVEWTAKGWRGSALGYGPRIPHQRYHCGRDASRPVPFLRSGVVSQRCEQGRNTIQPPCGFSVFKKCVIFLPFLTLFLSTLPPQRSRSFPMKTFGARLLDSIRPSPVGHSLGDCKFVCTLCNCVTRT